MQILEAVHCLVQELGIACGANDEIFRTKIGDGIANAVTSVQPWSEPEARGGDITIKLAGEAQPEAARTLQGIIDVILIKLELPPANARRRRTMSGQGGRSYLPCLTMRRTCWRNRWSAPREWCA